MKLFAVFIPLLLVVGCGGGDSTDVNENLSGNTTGTITLSGDDSAIVGTQLDTGHVLGVLATESQPDYVVIVDVSSSVTATSLNVLTPNVADLNNGFVMVVTDDRLGSGIKAISMSIVVDGTKFDYACTTLGTTFIECGANAISLNIGDKTVIFDNATVINTDTNATLTIDGTLTWSDVETTTTVVVGNGVATELDGTWVSACTESLDYAGLYETDRVIFSENTFTSSWVEYSDPACTVVDDTGSSTGTFVIGDSITTSSGLSAKKMDITTATMDGMNFTLTFYDIFKIEGGRLYFGDLGDYDEVDDDWKYSGLTTEKRPIDLEFSYFFTKQ